MSSQHPRLDRRCVAQRLFARAAACVHFLADCTTPTTASCAAEMLSSQESMALLSCGVMTVKSGRLFNLVKPARKAFRLAGASQRAAFAALSKW
ncbi:uncharacterized protein M421DRAFT_274168 [Didymella exigua CBS 183.55]|uniref:Uncharacterized protein n=1 Tax=Didymella exigua CBS 183.55 TaxID=1150837 RepID=A0A6A5RAN3_9PLEO|nr:uncharacterized protein M421DRAFT_274168 [Didymella exigua CBS 183.55]KAF1924682.1 hypothetical protein M421DRAFT_274168 [Didymella exigua CBS 183.55]